MSRANSVHAGAVVIGRFLESVWGVAALTVCFGIAVIGLGCGGEGVDDPSRGVRVEGTEPGDCEDGADNDADGLFDCDDSGCSGASVCSDGGVSGAGGFGGMMGSGGMVGGGGTSGTGGVGGAAGAGGTGGVGGVAGTGGTPLSCADLTNPPDDCDEPCTSDSQCVASFCENNTKCVAHCTADEGCDAGSSCNARGRCVPDMNTGGTGGTGNTGGNACQSVTVTPTRSIPNVMFLVDQSGSMTANFGGGEDRWEAAHSGINGIVSGIDSIVRFGLTTYTSRDGDFNPPCPRLPTQVDFALDNSGTIGNDSIYPYTYPTDAGEDTPTGDSIDALVGTIQASPPPAEGPTIIILATDGEPDSCEFPDPIDNTERDSARGEAVAASAGANAAGMDLFVLWVGELTSTSTRDHLQEVANVGVGLAADGSGGDAPFWVGDDPASLQGAFQQIISDSISCDIQMDERFDDKDKACAEGDVRLNGTPLNCPADWQVKPGADDVIQLVGSACDTLKSGDETFSAEFPCGAIIVE